MPRLPTRFASLFMLASSPLAAAVPTATDLGANNMVQAVSDDGSVATGLQIVFDDDPRPTGVTRWTPTGGTEFIGGRALGRPDVSADGGTIAATVMTAQPEAAFWTADAGWTPIGTMELIPAPPGWETISQAISANGERLAGGTVPSPVELGHVRGFSFNPDTWVDRWADYGWQELPKLRKGSVAEATGISDDGLVQAGISTTGTSSAYGAVLWRDGRIRELRSPDGTRLGGESVRCNNGCDVLVGGGGGSSAVNPVLAWRLKPGGRAPACHFRPQAGAPRHALRYYAYATSENGNVVAGSYYYDDVPEGGGPAPNIARAFLWIGDARGGTMHDLGTYLEGLGQDFFDGWQYTVATGLSADGRYLVGWGDDPAGVPRGWRIDFGVVPQATGPASDYTACPTGKLTPAPRAGDATGADDRETPFGEFRAAGQRYFVEPRGTRLFAGGDRARLAPLLALGGDLYYDAARRSRIAFVRDRGGLVVGMREGHGDGRPVTWRRRADVPRAAATGKGD